MPLAADQDPGDVKVLPSTGVSDLRLPVDETEVDLTGSLGPVNVDIGKNATVTGTHQVVTGTNTDVPLDAGTVTFSGTSTGTGGGRRRRASTSPRWWPRAPCRCLGHQRRPAPAHPGAVDPASPSTLPCALPDTGTGDEATATPWSAGDRYTVTTRRTHPGRHRPGRRLRRSRRRRRHGGRDLRRRRHRQLRRGLRGRRPPGLHGRPARWRDVRSRPGLPRPHPTTVVDDRAPTPTPPRRRGDLVLRRSRRLARRVTGPATTRPPARRATPRGSTPRRPWSATARGDGHRRSPAGTRTRRTPSTSVTHDHADAPRRPLRRARPRRAAGHQHHRRHLLHRRVGHPRLADLRHAAGRRGRRRTGSGTPATRWKVGGLEVAKADLDLPPQRRRRSSSAADRRRLRRRARRQPHRPAPPRLRRPVRRDTTHEISGDVCALLSVRIAPTARRRPDGPFLGLVGFAAGGRGTGRHGSHDLVLPTASRTSRTAR